MFQRNRTRLQVESLEDRCTPSMSPFGFASLFSQLESRLTAALQSLQNTFEQHFSPPALPAFPLPAFPLPAFPSIPQLPDLPAFPPITLPQFSQFSQFPPQLPQFSQSIHNQLDSRFSELMQAANNLLQHVNTRAADLFDQLFERLAS